MSDRDLLKKALVALDELASGIEEAWPSLKNFPTVLNARAVHAEIKAALDSDAARTGQDEEEG